MRLGDCRTSERRARWVSLGSGPTFPDSSSASPPPALPGARPTPMWASRY